MHRLQYQKWTSWSNPGSVIFIGNGADWIEVIGWAGGSASFIAVDPGVTLQGRVDMLVQIIAGSTLVELPNTQWWQKYPETSLKSK